MHKKIEIIDLNIPKDDIDAWNRYPKFHWMYDLSRLLDAQNIKWSPFRTEYLDQKRINMHLESKEIISFEPSVIYIKEPIGKKIITEVYIIKGEIKLMRHNDFLTKKELQEEMGEIELRLNAFSTLYFQKFTGVITAELIGNEIYSIRLRPYSELSVSTNSDSIKLIKRIYKKHDINTSGLTDQVFHDSIAS